MNWQPWYRWQADSKTLERQSAGAAKRILGHLQAMNQGSELLTLYRGASQVPGKYSPAAADPYQRPLKEANLIFATPSRSGALKFASPYLLSTKIPFKELYALLEGNRPSLYVGVEFDYVELAFLVTKAPTSTWFSAFTLECTQGTRVGSFAQCPDQPARPGG